MNYVNIHFCCNNTNTKKKKNINKNHIYDDNKREYKKLGRLQTPCLHSVSPFCPQSGLSACMPGACHKYSNHEVYADAAIFHRNPVETNTAI